jgi:uncharacterized protein (TIGR00661 family)
MIKTEKPRVFICPLNWGMGHASRVIPVVDHFQSLGYEILLGGSGKSGTLLQSAFPGLPFYTMPLFEITYSKRGFLLGFSIIRQIPAFLKAAIKEHRVLNRMISELQIDVVISDNRYGLFNSKAHCILITHQISPILPFIMRWAEYPVYLALKRVIRKFDECWIPDFKDPALNLSGQLSHRFSLHSNTRFIGILSRFTKITDQSHSKKHSYDMVIVLSGPPPHSEIFAHIVIRQSLQSAQKILIISGFQNIPASLYHSNITIVKHLETKDFRTALMHAKIVVCRAGYSGIMDLIALGRTAYIIPTPGQTEQQYLANYLGSNPLFRSISQQCFHLNELVAIPEGKTTKWLDRIHNLQQELPSLNLDNKGDEHSEEPC